DPLGLIASGSLLLAVDPRFSRRVQARLSDLRIDVTRIGRVRPVEFGAQLIGPGGPRPLPAFSRDEIVRLFE
ncbi:MAG: hydrogenase expression/formation protein, partial [Anaerolineae bacterium]